MRRNLWRCLEHIEALSRRRGKYLHLDLEPEPLCYLETTAEVIDFFEQMEGDRPGDERLRRHLALNYDTCHMAVEYEEPEEALNRLRQHQIKIGKMHLSSALKLRAGPEARAALARFADNVYLHQVIARDATGALARFKDLEMALKAPVAPDLEPPEWRVHFHVPLHSPGTALLGNTAEDIARVAGILQRHPGLCSHLEMETYTWAVLPPDWQSRSVVEQLALEYEWTLKRFAEKGFEVAQ
jgi:hypothetical protein